MPGGHADPVECQDPAESNTELGDVETLSVVLEGKRLVSRHGVLSALEREVRPGMKPDGCFGTPPTPDVASLETLLTKHRLCLVGVAGRDATGPARGDQTFTGRGRWIGGSATVKNRNDDAHMLTRSRFSRRPL